MFPSVNTDKSSNKFINLLGEMFIGKVLHSSGSSLGDQDKFELCEVHLAKRLNKVHKVYEDEMV